MKKNITRSIFVGSTVLFVIFLAIFVVIFSSGGGSLSAVYAEETESYEDFELKIKVKDVYYWIVSDACTCADDSIMQQCDMLSTTPFQLHAGSSFDFEKFKKHFSENIGFREGSAFQYFTSDEKIFGWEDCVVPNSFQKIIEILPQYQVEKYTFIFKNLNDYEKPFFSKVYLATDMNFLPIVNDQDGLIFDGWKVIKYNGTDVKNGTFYSIDKMQGNVPIGDLTKGEQKNAELTLEAQFHAQVAKVNIVSQQKIISTFIAEYGKELTGLPTMSNFENYRFVGFFDNPLYCGTVYTKSSIWNLFDRNVGEYRGVLYAKWMLDTCSITYDLKGGVTSNPQKYQKPVILSEAVRSGYCFNGWKNKATDAQVTKISSGNYALEAQWTQVVQSTSSAPITITEPNAVIDFDLLGAGSIPESITVTSTVNNLTVKGGWNASSYLSSKAARTRFDVTSGSQGLTINLDTKIYALWNHTAMVFTGAGMITLTGYAKIYGGTRTYIQNTISPDNMCCAIFSGIELNMSGNLSFYGGVGSLFDEITGVGDALFGGTAVYALGLNISNNSSIYCYGGNGGSAYNQNTNGGDGRYGLRLSPLVGLKNEGYVYCKGGKGGTGKGTGSSGMDYSPRNSFIVRGSGTLVEELAS